MKKKLTVDIANGTASRTTDHDYTHCVVFFPTEASHARHRTELIKHIKKLEAGLAEDEERVAWYAEHNTDRRPGMYGSVYHLEGEKRCLEASAKRLKETREELAYVESVDYAHARGAAVSWHSSEALARKALSAMGTAGPLNYKVVPVNK